MMRVYLTLALGFLFTAAGTVGCSGGASGPGQGSGGATATGGGGGNASRTGGSSGGGRSGGTGGALVGGAGGAGQPKKIGVCGQRGRATANAAGFDGYEEMFLIGEEGLGTDECVVRFDLKRVGVAPAGCTDCLWTHVVEYTNPTVVTDVGGACASVTPALDAAAIARVVGSRIAIGFAPELEGAHGSARMRYFEATMKWDVFGNATWDETANAFRYDHRDGLCDY